MNEIFKNAALFNQASAFTPISPVSVARWGETPTPEQIMKPVEYTEDGEVIVRMIAKGAKSVKVTSSGITSWKFEIEMDSRGNGIFEAKLPKDDTIFGNVVLNFIVDGSPVINPHLPTEFLMSKIVNCVEIPDKGAPYIYLRDVPHGTVAHEIFWSETVQEWVRCTVYLPPSYGEGGEFPVLYLQHGATENETCWIYNGKLPFIMDNNIADGKAVPFIVVMNNGMMRRPGENHINDFAGIEGIITKDCREYIEKKYRVKKDRENRAIAGLSLGSMQALYIGLRNQELYASIGSFTFLRCRDRDNTYEGNPHLDALKDAEKFWSNHKLLFRSIGSDEREFNEFIEDDEFLAQYGTDQNPNYHRHVYEGQVHNWNCWRRALNDFCQVVFK